MDKQQELLNAALKLFVENGFHGTATSKIAKEAGVANGTLFHYYPTKDELIVALYIKIKTDMSCYVDGNAGEADFKTRFKNQFTHALYWSRTHKAEFQYIQQFYASPYAAQLQSETLKQQMERTCMEIQTAIDDQLIRDFPVDYIFSLVSGHLNGISQYLNQAQLGEKREKEVIAETFELLWKMLS